MGFCSHSSKKKKKKRSEPGRIKAGVVVAVREGRLSVQPQLEKSTWDSMEYRGFPDLCGDYGRALLQVTLKCYPKGTDIAINGTCCQELLESGYYNWYSSLRVTIKYEFLNLLFLILEARLKNHLWEGHRPERDFTTVA